jgi:hypothetical protein
MKYTKTWSDEFIVYGSKNSVLVDTINYTNEFNKENEQKAKEKEEEDALLATQNPQLSGCERCLLFHFLDLTTVRF